MISKIYLYFLLSFLSLDIFFKPWKDMIYRGKEKLGEKCRRKDLRKVDFDLIYILTYLFICHTDHSELSLACQNLLEESEITLKT